MSDDGPRSSEQAPDPRIGAILDGRYRLIRRLGEGGFGVVYEAEHEVIRRKVAVKMLHASFAAEPEVMARFRREAIAATTIGHPHIVEVLDMGRADDGAAYMALELLEGRDWAHVLEESGAQPLGRTVHILLQVLDGLSAAHDKGIIHRDLKAENVFLITRGADADFVKIVDFGISKIVEEGGGKDVVLTRTGAAMGTPVAMSPEQFQGKKDVDHRADLWALGVMLYRALSARWPFTGETYAMLAVNVMTEHPTPLEVLRPDLPPAVCAVVARLMEKDRGRRFASAREVRAALEPFAQDRSPAPALPPGSGIVRTRVGVDTPEALALAATGAGPTIEPTPRPTDAPPFTAAAATPRGTDAPPAPTTTSISPPLLAVGLLVGALLVGGTWWVAGLAQRAEPESDTPTSERALDAMAPLDAATAPAEVSDAREMPDAAPAEAQPEAHRERERVRPRRDGEHEPASPPDPPEPPGTTAAPPPATEPLAPPTTTEPATPPTTSVPVTPPTTSRPGLRRPLQ